MKTHSVCHPNIEKRQYDLCAKEKNKDSEAFPAIPLLSSEQIYSVSWLSNIDKLELWGENLLKPSKKMPKRETVLLTLTETLWAVLCFHKNADSFRRVDVFTVKTGSSVSSCKPF